MSEIKLFRPQRLTDNPDGGGLATATEIVDGEVNNLFDDISRIDRVNGELSLRKVFPIAATENTELFSDLHVIVQSPPLDPRVSSVIFRTNTGWGDEREDAKEYVERYLDPSVITRMIPYDRQLQGQRTVLVYQRPELSLPEIGEVYALVNETVGTSEYFRVQDIDHEVQTFTDADGDYQARVITLTISQALTREFLGSQPNRYFTAESGRSQVRKTIASDAARYRGVVRLAHDASAGDLGVKVESVYAQLVPAAASEVAVTDTPPPGVTGLVASSHQTLTFTAHSQRIWRLPTAIEPGSLRTTVSLVAFDDGLGSLRNGSPTGPITGAIDYARGLVELGGVPGTVAMTYRPAAVVSKAAQSHQIPVTLGNRGYVYVATLVPLPAPGSTSVSFRALGRWYTLQDDGTGALRADSGVGVGTVNFQTGTVSVSLGAMPDVGSSVVIAWGTRSEYEIRTGDLQIETPAVRLQLGAGNCEPGTLTVQWEAGGVTRSASADAGGQISGDASGRVVHATGEVLLRPLVLPDSNTLFACDYEAGISTTEVFTPSASGGSVVVTASGAPIRPGSVRLAFAAFAENSDGLPGSVQVELTDNGAGALLDETGQVVAGASVVYASGIVTFPATYMRTMQQLTRAEFGGILPDRVGVDASGRFILKQYRWLVPSTPVNGAALAGFINGTAVSLSFKLDSVADEVVAEEHEPGPLRIDLTPRVRNAIVPGGVYFTLAGRDYFARQGTLYYGVDLANGAGTPAGTIDYSTGEVAITSYVGGVAPGLTLRALLTEVSPLPVYMVNGRTPGSPLRPGTFQIRANRVLDGQMVMATADQNGNISTADMRGTVDSVTGVFAIAFGAYVLDSSLSPEERAANWYSPDNVDADGYIWRPREVIPGTVAINCVVQVALPMDPDIIKVNPVRLPMDGRVPVIRAGDTLVIHEPLPHPLPAGLAGGQVVNLPRGGLASIAVYDAAGRGVPLNIFQHQDLEAGQLTLASPLNLDGFQQPLVVIHTVEDMALCLDAQLNGEVTLGQPLTHGYSAGAGLVSSALILGDAQARYERLFAQNTWTGEWSNERIGTPPTGGAQFNDALWPIEVVNAHAITERWRLQFTSPTAFNVIGEQLGVISTGNTSQNVAPINPATGEPYFVIPAAGFGAGWANGNNLRFNTVAAGGPFWVARTVLSGPATNLDDRIRLQTRWDKD
ncbi:hypothetical protein CO641_02440 [Lysobacteraceae bacterium NML91-0213]|nr:hypothetical protein CO641_02440 [Xanthomonadaceae bacterium NML91-0213]